jgi:hypothetical protein
MNVSKLTKVKIKDIWKTEDRDFTPWLVENIARLNEDIGFNIQDPQKENRLENFIVDIVGEDNEGKVIIENQYNKSDHDHLGKLLTYLSNVPGTKKAIWIVEEARADHVSTINWLNENVETCSFYLVKIEVFKIQDSPPAANFDLLAGPSEITKIKQKINVEDSNRGKARFEFWELFLEKSKSKTKMYNNISPRVYAWLGTSTGLRGVGYNCAVLKNSAQAEIYIDRGKDNPGENKEIFDELEKNKLKIEEKFGDKLEWEPLPDSRACRIKKVIEIGGWQNEDKWEEVHEKLIDYCMRMKDSFDPIISNLQKKY